MSPDTDTTPDCGKTSASRQTFVSGKAAELAGRALRAAILRAANAGESASIEFGADAVVVRSEEHTSELQSLMRISYAVFCLKKKKQIRHTHISHQYT